MVILTCDWQCNGSLRVEGLWGEGCTHPMLALVNRVARWVQKILLILLLSNSCKRNEGSTSPKYAILILWSVNHLVQFLTGTKVHQFHALMQLLPAPVSTSLKKSLAGSTTGQSGIKCQGVYYISLLQACTNNLSCVIDNLY